MYARVSLTKEKVSFRHNIFLAIAFCNKNIMENMSRSVIQPKFGSETGMMTFGKMNIVKGASTNWWVFV